MLGGQGAAFCTGLEAYRGPWTLVLFVPSTHPEFVSFRDGFLAGSDS